MSVNRTLSNVKRVTRHHREASLRLAGASACDATRARFRRLFNDVYLPSDDNNSRLATITKLPDEIGPCHPRRVLDTGDLSEDPLGCTNTGWLYKLPSLVIQNRIYTPPDIYAPFGVSGLVPFSHCDWLKGER
ncbi:hypothetical protein EVAR_20083_1 [Eumeta japonica]|uniref:Uncharacterized protein n=1 Tax=Eumeta variegata TaxID=151549 RepID=A0A4C1UIZ5_EUMVA|nr:hypothetical protein EVAR_20083_1 [Eumeta japonica]